MLLKLSGQALQPLSPASTHRFVGRIRTNGAEPDTRDILRVGRGGKATPGFRAYLFDEPPAEALHRDSYQLAPEWDYLSDGDVVRVDLERRALTALYRRRLPSNSFLVTERCDNYRIMCSLPPKERDDSRLVDELADVIPVRSGGT